MATYLQGVTDYVPQVQPWRPNYNFYQPIFQQKQAKYDQGWNKINNMYNSVLNAPMLREDNKLRRDDFFKNAQQQIQQLSGVDLSLAQNVDAAAQVFAPFYEDAGIVKDLGFTKKYQDEMQRAEYLRNCTDPKKCGDKYWSGGVRAMNYQAEDFVNATAEEALKMRAPQYTEYYNLMKNAQEAVKDAGLSMKIDSKQGGYIVTTKNGSQMTMPLMNFMMQRFGNDPRLQEFYSTKAMLLTRENPEAANAMYLKSMQNPGVPQEQLQEQTNNEVFTQTYTDSKAVIANTANREENRFMNMVRKKDVLEARIRKNGIVPGSPEANDFIASVRDANAQEGVSNDLNNMNESAQNTDAGLQEQGLTANRDQMRNVIANAMKIQDMYNTANTLAYKDYERTIKADPFALQNNSFNNQVKMASINNQYKLQNSAYDYIYKRSLAQIKNAQTTGATGTAINFWSRPSNNYYDRLNQFQNTGNATGQAPAPGTMGDQLAANILAGMSNPMSNVSTAPEMIARLMAEGRTADANTVAQGNSGTRYPFEAGRGVRLDMPLTEMPDIDYDFDEAGDGVNVMKSTLDRYQRIRRMAGWGTFLGMPIYRFSMEHSGETIKKMRDGFNDVRAYTSEQINGWKNTTDAAKTQINSDILGTEFRIAGDESHPESDAMQLELLDFTSHIDANWKYWGKRLKKQFGGNISTDYQAYKRAADAGWGDIPSLTAEEFKTMRWGLPTNTERSWAVNAKQFRKIKNIGFDKLIAMAGGNDGLYQFNEEAGGSWIPEGEGGTYIDAAEAGIMNHSEYAELQNVRQEEAGNLEEDGSYVNPKLTPEVIAALDKYEKYNSQTEFERKWGVGSGISEIQMVNAVHAPRKIQIALEDQGAQNAIDNFNTGLNAAASQLTPQTTSVSGSIWNAIMDKLVIQGGDGELSRIATKSELNGILAESIPELLADPSWAQRNNILHGKWGHSINKFKNMNMYDGKTSTKSMLNMLSVSNYASSIGASKGTFTTTYTAPDWELSAPGYSQAIAGWKFAQDQKKPFEERQYTSLGQALAETRDENPFDANPGEISYGTFSISTNGEGKSEKYNQQAQKFLQFLGNYEDAVGTEYKNGGKSYNVSPNYLWYDRYKNASDPRGASMGTLGFDLNLARLDEAWINVFEDHNNTIGTAYEELLNNFTDQKSSFGGMFTGDDGKPVGQGTMVAAPATMHAVTPNRQDQNYLDSRYIIDEAIKNGTFSADSKVGPEVLNKLSGALKDPEGFSKGKAPMWDLEVHPFAGEYGTSEYTLTLLDDTWLEAQGYNKKKGGSGGIEEGTEAPYTYKWTVENPTDPLSTGAHPTAWDATIGNLGTGETYTNTALGKQYGNIHYSKMDEGSVQPGYTIDLFNPQTGEEEEITFYAPAQSYYGTDWTSQQINLVDEMIQAKAISEDTKRQYTMLRGLKDPQELLTKMAEEFGVSVEELLQSFN
jgi:hypothetical protein